MTAPNRTSDTGSAEPTEPNHAAEPSQTSEPRRLGRVLRFRRAGSPTEPRHRAEPVRSSVAVTPATRHDSRIANAEPPASDAPDPNRRGPAYWFEELTGVVPLAAPLLIEAVIHARFAEHVIKLEQPAALLFPAAIGLGAVRVAFYLDRARLRRGDPTGLARFGLYAYMAAGFALSFFYLSEFDQKTGARLGEKVEGDALPAIVVGCAQAAGVLLWELRTRQRRREVDRAHDELDEDRMRRALRFPIWHARMVSWSVATGERDWSRVVAAFAPLILAQKAGQAHDRWPTLIAEPVRAEPVVAEPAARKAAPTRKASRPRTEPARVVEPTRAAEPVRTEPSRHGPISVTDLELLVRLVAARPNRETPSRREVEPILGVGSTVAGRLRRYYETAAGGEWFDELLEQARQAEQRQAAQ